MLTIETLLETHLTTYPGQTTYCGITDNGTGTIADLPRTSVECRACLNVDNGLCAWKYTPRQLAYIHPDHVEPAWRLSE